MIISFAWTTPALLAGAKTMTRRDWKPMHAARIHAGALVDAWDKSPRAHGRKVATIRITKAPYRGLLRDVGGRDWSREGFAWLATHGERELAERIWYGWKNAEPGATLYVVEFELVDAWDEYHRTSDEQLREVLG